MDILFRVNFASFILHYSYFSQEVISATYREEYLSKDGRFPGHIEITGCLSSRKMAVMPLVKKDGLPEKAQKIMNMLNCEFRL